MEIYRAYAGHCPHLNDEMEISILYSSPSVLKAAHTEYKRLEYSCANIDECPYSQCPIYEKSPIIITD